MTKDDEVFSAVDIVNRRVEKELEGYSRAFAICDRLTSNSMQGDEIRTRKEQDVKSDGE